MLKTVPPQSRQNGGVSDHPPPKSIRAGADTVKHDADTEPSRNDGGVRAAPARALMPGAWSSRGRTSVSARARATAEARQLASRRRSRASARASASAYSVLVARERRGSSWLLKRKSWAFQ